MVRDDNSFSVRLGINPHIKWDSWVESIVRDVGTRMASRLQLPVVRTISRHKDKGCAGYLSARDSFSRARSFFRFPSIEIFNSTLDNHETHVLRALYASSYLPQDARLHARAFIRTRIPTCITRYPPRYIEFQPPSESAASHILESIPRLTSRGQKMQDCPSFLLNAFPYQEFRFRMCLTLAPRNRRVPFIIYAPRA